jgi:hypothetical protein
MSKIKPLARQTDIVVQEMGNEILIYDLKANKAFNLNETSALIWQLADGKKDIAEIADNLSRRFDSAISEEFVWLALGELQKKDLLVNQNEMVKFFQGVSRREVIRRIGLTTIISFPIISTLIFPSSIQALSCPASGSNRPLGCPCTAVTQCSSGCCDNSSPRVCIVNNSEPIGSTCQTNCECINDCCGFGGICAALDSVGMGGSCRVDCECENGDCVGNICN